MSNFSDLDLGDLGETSPTRKTLAPGNYILAVTDVGTREAKNGQAHFLDITFTCPETNQYVNDSLMFAHKGAKTVNGSENNYQKAVSIGRQRLKKILTFGGHPSPDKPGDPESLIGLKLGVRVKEGDAWTNMKGELVSGGGEVFPTRDAYFAADDRNVVIGENLAARAPVSSAGTPTPNDAPDDAIPF